MKIEKNFEHHPERSRSLPRRVTWENLITQARIILPPARMHVIKISTLNINGITAPTKVGMLSDFITRPEIGII
jgi:hypothetical protein